MKLSEITATLARLEARPTQSLGQNFLHDQNVARWIVEQAEIGAEDTWLEIGPGLGALTEYAAEKSGNGIILEKDDRLAPWLRERFPQLEVVHGDALKYDVRNLFLRGPVKVFGNLPYYVSSQLLFQFTDEPSPAESMVFMLQRELAERLSAGVESDQYGGISVLVGRRWTVKYLRTIPASVFTPVPKVESALIRLTVRPPGEIPDCDGALYSELVKRGFSQRRKQLRKMLQLEKWAEFADQLGVSQTARAEELSLVQWATLTNLVTGHTGDQSQKAQDSTGEIFDVVNDKNKVVDQRSRGEVHRDRLLHRAVHIFVFNKRGELFLQKRSRWKDICPGRWDSSAAGHVNSGDDFDSTAPRELEEELGVSAPLECIGEIDACKDTGWEFVKVYRAEHNGPFRLPPAEIECGGFFTPEQLDAWIAARPKDFASGFRTCWKMFRQ